MNGRVKQVRHFVEYCGMKSLAKVVPLLSRRHSEALVSIIGWTAYQIDRRGRFLAEENLNLAKQENCLSLTDEEIKSTIRTCYQNFARNFIDLFWFPRLNSENLSQWVELEGHEAIEQIRDSGRGGIFLTPHFGSFEWTSLVLGLLGVQVDIVARKFRNPRIESIFTNARQLGGHRVHHCEQVVLRLLRSLRRGASIAMLPDLAIAPQRAATSVAMFGRSTTLTTLPAELAIRCSVPIIAAICEPLPRGRARLKVIKVIDPTSADASSGDLTKHYTQAIWQAFEKEIQRRPDCWLWMYKHWRYSHCASLSPSPPADEEKQDGADTNQADVA